MDRNQKKNVFNWAKCDIIFFIRPKNFVTDRNQKYKKLEVAEM